MPPPSFLLICGGFKMSETEKKTEVKTGSASVPKVTKEVKPL